LYSSAIDKSIAVLYTKGMRMRIGEKGKTEDALLRVAESLLEQGGPDAVTTRAVCDAANVGAPTLYHHYGDKNGLLDALVAKGVKAFLKGKQAVPNTADARADLISGWESFVEFALERPQLFRLMVQRVGENPQILDAAMATTNARLIRLADEKRLTTDVAFARQSLLALSLGVTALGRHGASKAEVKAVGRFLLDATLSALVRSKRP
jgi:AcrR family transcriptional regulator